MPPPPFASDKPTYAKRGYRYLIDNFLAFLLTSITILILVHITRLGPETLLANWASLDLKLTHVVSVFFLISAATTFYFNSRPRPIFLVDFACFKPPSTCRVPFSSFMEHATLLDNFNAESVKFQMRILERSGLGEETYLPPAMHYLPPSPTMVAARVEAELVIFSAIDELVKRTGLMPKDVDILILNCTLFSPTPSLSALVVNKYKMRSDVKSYNLSGMGCSAGLISINLARDLLQVHKNSNALVISTEIVTPNWYPGNNRSMLLPNCLFRLGGAALLLSNSRDRQKCAKYKLAHVVRTHKGADDRAYLCLGKEEDSHGIPGVYLSKDLTAIAGEALKSNLTAIGPLVLPASEQLLFLLTLIGQKIFSNGVRPYIPEFNQVFEHICIHAGGRAVIDELQKSLRLSAEHVEPSRMALHRFGNTSSSSLWYELAYIEAKGRMKKGDRIWQIALGSGFKCNSAVWKCNRNIQAPVADGPWADCADKYPVHIP